MRFSSRLENVRLSLIRQVMMQAGGCINLGIGEPDFLAPPVVRQEAHRVLQSEKIGYSPTAGIPELREAVLNYHEARPQHAVCVTNGSQEALFDLIFALTDPGDEILVPNPGFPAYPTVVRLAGGIPVEYPLRAEESFAWIDGQLEALVSARTRAIILNSPSNPTGRVLTREQMQFATELASERGFTVISDEIYREIYYTPEPPASVMEWSDQAVILSGVSKMANMTGWRVGWACGPQEIIEKLTVMHQYTSSCASTLSQKAACTVFSKEGQAEIERQRRLLRENCEFLCSLVDRRLRVPYVRPEGAFYLMLSLSDFEIDSLSVSLELLKDGVATIPGAAFGSQGEGYLRISFACEQERIAEGISRIEKGFQRLRPAPRVS